MRAQQLLLEEKDKDKASHHVRKAKIIGMTFPNTSCFDFDLPEATLFNNGGFRLPPNIAVYSPIDLAIALYSNKKFKNLKEFFATPNIEAEYLVNIVVLDDSVRINRNIAEWKYYLLQSKDILIRDILQANAPFTFNKK